MIIGTRFPFATCRGNVAALPRFCLRTTTDLTRIIFYKSPLHYYLFHIQKVR